jgi:hypothetical protein
MYSYFVSDASQSLGLFKDEVSAAICCYRQANVAAWYECFGALRLFDDWLKLVQPLETIRATLHS